MNYQPPSPKLALPKVQIRHHLRLTLKMDQILEIGSLVEIVGDVNKDHELKASETFSLSVSISLAKVSNVSFSRKLIEARDFKS